MRILTALVCSVVLLSLVGCHTVRGRDVGMVVGAGAGAAAGYQIGKGLE